MAYKIHCSDTTHSILERLGGFTFEKRGTITVKGKGEMQTWWVLGRTRAELAKDCCPLPMNWKKKLKKKIDVANAAASVLKNPTETSPDSTKPDGSNKESATTQPTETLAQPPAESTDQVTNQSASS